MTETKTAYWPHPFLTEWHTTKIAPDLLLTKALNESTENETAECQLQVMQNTGLLTTERAKHFQDKTKKAEPHNAVHTGDKYGSEADVFGFR